MKILIVLMLAFSLVSCEKKKEKGEVPGSEILAFELSNISTHEYTSNTNLFELLDSKYKYYFDSNNPTKIALFLERGNDAYKIYLLRTFDNTYELRVFYTNNDIDATIMFVDMDGTITTGETINTFNLSGSWKLKERILK